MILEFMCVVCFSRFNFLKISCFFLDAENPMNRTTTSVYLNIDDDDDHRLNKNSTCSSLKYCNNRGRCLIIENQMKCL
jgi:hypothetical protein